MTIRDLEPKVVWENFYGLTQIPRPSKHEEKVIEYLYQWGKERGIETIKDETGNIIMRKPAKPGFEKCRGVIMQAHMDMVPQKAADKEHNFLTDPIQTRICDDGWVRADRTTLGADNGIGVAMALAVLEDDTVNHGPVEVLITYDEETGMTGALELRPDKFKGDILLNLDSEMEGELCVGCAGGLDAEADFEYTTKATPSDYVAYQIRLKGFAGGHSGMDIPLCRANANKIIAKTVLPLIQKMDVKLASIHGGSLRNAIPFAGVATVLVPKSREEEVKSSVEKTYGEFKFEHQYSDPEGQYYFEKLDEIPAEYIEEDVVERVMKSVIACPSNVIRMSDTMKGLTETSVNLAIVKSENGHIYVQCLMRSAIEASKAALAERLQIIFELAGAKYSTSGAYPGWTPKIETPVYKIIMDVYKKMFNKDMEIMATHGGLECALLGEKYPHWEMASIGPDIRFPHSPDEKVNIQSVANTWEFLKRILEVIPEA